MVLDLSLYYVTMLSYKFEPIGTWILDGIDDKMAPLSLFAKQDRFMGSWN